MIIIAPSIATREEPGEPDTEKRQDDDPMSGPRGSFITFEGVDGAGKSTHLDWFAQELRTHGLDVVVTREPGGTPAGEVIRDLVLHHPVRLDTEALLMFAARAEHLDAVIRPALKRGSWVVCDRFTDATFAYQGGARGLSMERLSELEHWVHPDLRPDCTMLFEIDVREAARRRSGARQADRFEKEDIDFFEKVIRGYAWRRERDPDRFVTIDANQSIETIRIQLIQTIHRLIETSENRNR